jgi:asparagine synthase (glutamine-hydrolysing)
LAPLLARSAGLAEICYPEKVEALLRTFGDRGGKHEGIACWQLLFYALWHRVHVEQRTVAGDVFAALEAR